MPTDRLAALMDAYRAKGRVLTAFSGGVDSAVLARVAHDALGADALAVIVESESFARAERDGAVRLAEEAGFRFEVVETSELADPRYAANPVNRCYFCRQGLADVTRAIAREKGFDVVSVGTNTDDLADYRPGLRAIREAGLWEPFVELGIDKAGVRAVARELGLPVADKPAMACLSSRIPYGERVTEEKLRRVERAEAWLRELGFRQVRVRTLEEGALARVEVEEEAVPRLLAMRAAVERELGACGYARVELDERGYRTGALNAGIPVAWRVGSSG